jgi:signal transduction histidine kinase
MSLRQPVLLRGRPELVSSWVATAVAVCAFYGAVVLGAELFTASAPPLLLSVAATVVVAAGIGPLQRRLEERASRVVHGDRQAPYEVLQQFTSELSAACQPEALPHRMARLLAEGTTAAWAEVWVVVNGRLTLVAAHPDGSGGPTDPPPVGAPQRGDGIRSVTVGHEGEPLAVLRVQERPGRPLSPVEERLFAGLAAQAGLALHAARLRAELTVRHEELSASTEELRRARERLVAAQDQERRKLERDIHDGAQQQLVALGINLRLAQTLAGHGSSPARADQVPARARELLGMQASAATDALQTLASLARGVQPPVLREQGLLPALRRVADTSPVPILVRAGTGGAVRLDPHTEAALYFCATEAIQNAVKHAAASRVDVVLTVEDGRASLSVTDDGSGVVAASRGSGIANMHDRLTSLAGTLSIDSGAGRGTTVTARVPVAAAREALLR